MNIEYILVVKILIFVNLIYFFVVRERKNIIPLIDLRPIFDVINRF